MWTVVYQCHPRGQVNVAQGYSQSDFIQFCSVLAGHGYEFLAEKSAT